MTTRRALLGAAGAAGAAGLVSAPAIAQGDAAHTLRFIPQADVTVIDPLSTTSYAVRNHGHMCWDTLYGLDADYRPQPQLAEGHVVADDGRRWTFTLRDGPTFHDGEKIRAADAVASIRRWMVRDTHGQTLAARREEIRALDDRRFEIRLKRPFGVMLDALGKASSYPCFIMPERFASLPATTPLTEIVGSGPYRFVAEERRAGAQVVYRKYDRYVPTPVGTPGVTAGPKLAHFERMEWRHIPDPSTAAAALQSGEIDVWERMHNDLRSVLARRRDVVLDRVETSGTVVMLRPNHLHPPFDDPAVRRAVWPALAQADFMQSIMGNDRSLWRDGVGCFPPGTALASDEGLSVLTGPRDLNAAKAALAATGKAGAKVVVLDPADQPNNNALTLVAIDMLRKMGFEVEDAVSDWGTLLQRRGNKAPPAQGGWNAVVVLFGGDDLSNPGGHPLLRANGQDAWFGWPSSPRLEALRNEWLEAPDVEAQKRIGQAIQAQFMQDVPYWPLGQYFIDCAHRRGLNIGRRGMMLPLNLRREA
ncbi:ABC transporter substrate-binding protein [Roseomonas xinghualingensis]|uniref:ABC transporter substrate-binding protein n=1 Tax=Roseomonas xinghualingensis TaxID=2986475 RepID=UPI0021F1A491|nr:ABC transporter substrate-binding protein [Roseomonas sp. SXEYE001]MCV4207467.1 ABC transporter substrate-binding protein [Roseomonas sp. SXEYE001]